jgi:hypothetical protein
MLLPGSSEKTLSGVIEVGHVSLTVLVTFPERTDVVLGRSRRDF